ncbi:hypothetical protein [Streptomyces sp. bgisy027]|uniref:hypothetical protein n=1 Tax=Streptomyces sp. bgisy027 TaxID=3413770 RepID=UPI003D70D0E8
MPMSLPAAGGQMLHSVGAPAMYGTSCTGLAPTSPLLDGPESTPARSVDHVHGFEWRST